MVGFIRAAAVPRGPRTGRRTGVRTTSPAAPAGPASRPASAEPRTFRRRLAAYVALTKPRVIELLLVTTLPTMILAQGGFPSIGLVLATVLTAASFYVVYTHLIWAPAIPIALAVLAVAQIGVHLVFFLHITTAPDNTNNILALAFGVLIVVLIIGGSLWIMENLNRNMMPYMPMHQMMQMQR